MTHIGHCACKGVSYEMRAEPLIVHCCHCTWCQRETGSAFVLNAVIEARHVAAVEGAPDIIETPSESGMGQRISRCPTCKVALWSVYSGMGEKFRFVRVGTLENAARFPPDVHIFTSTKLSWVQLSQDVPIFQEYYRRSTVWSEESIERRTTELARAD